MNYKLLYEKAKKLITLHQSIIDWLEMRVNDLDSYDFYTGAKERLDKLESELQSLEESASLPSLTKERIIEVVDKVYEEWLTDGSSRQTLGEVIASALPEPEKEDKPQSGGWECPRCHKIHSWLEMSCDCPPKVYSSTTYFSTDKSVEPDNLMNNKKEELKEIILTLFPDYGLKRVEEVIEKYIKDHPEPAKEVKHTEGNLHNIADPDYPR